MVNFDANYSFLIACKTFISWREFAQAMAGYEFIEHTADIGIKATGDTLADAFGEAAIGMFSIITDTSQIEEVGEYDIAIDADDLEQLLVDWLTELLYLFDAQEILFKRFDIDIKQSAGKGAVQLNAKVFGEQLDRARHPLKVEIKAVTYHMIVVDEASNTVKVLFDI